MSDPQKVTGLIRTQGTTRVYQMEDGSVETREGGTVSWRNNNPGNLKFVYANSADTTVRTTRTKDEALAAAQNRYEGVVALDQWGNAVFETEATGRAAKAQLLRSSHGDKTIAEMLKGYAIDDYSGKANTDAYARSVYAEGDRQGVDLRNQKINELNSQEFEALLDGMKKVEGFREGTVSRTAPTRADAGAPASLGPADLSSQEQRVHGMAVEALGRHLGDRFSPEQIDTMARSTTLFATDRAMQGDVHDVLVSKDGQRIALHQSHGISEIDVQAALRHGPASQQQAYIQPAQVLLAMQQEERQMAMAR